MTGVLDIVKDQFDEWYIAPLHVPRGMTAQALSDKLAQHGISQVTVFDDIQAACTSAVSVASEMIE